MTNINLISFSPYFFLLFSVLLTLAGRGQKMIFTSLCLSLLAAILTERVSGLSIAVFVLLPVVLFVWVNHYFADFLRKLSFLLFLIMGYLLATHSLAQVNNLKLFDQLVFGKGMVPFNMFLNFDKVYLGVVLVNMLPPLERAMNFRASGLTILKYFAASLLFLFPAAYFSGFIQPHLNSNPYLILWAINNLLFVCFAEEVIFRRFIQNYLVDYFRNTQYGDLVSIFLAALIFGLAHISGGFLYVALAALAGIFYGLCFYHTCNIRSSMALHFMINLCHALFFTYPHALN